MKKYKRGLVWLRRDLRLTDHRALFEASLQCAEVVVVFVFDSLILNKLKNRTDRRVTFILESLKELDQKLKDFGSQLCVSYGDPVSEIFKLSEALEINAVFANKDYESYAKNRDLRVKEQLKKRNIEFNSYKDQVVFEELEVKNGKSEPYKVFTPYKNQWLKQLKPIDIKEFNPIDIVYLAQEKIKKHSLVLDYKVIHFKKNKIDIDPGERAAQFRLNHFLSSVHLYHLKRDFPALEDGTSGLSVHLRFGTISIRELFRKVLSQKNKSKGSEVWVSELIWREFYQMILNCFPHVEKEAFRSEYNKIKWPGKKEHFIAWCEGQTGYPLIDAAMRYFNLTGIMHNRLRMVVASFLVKDLLIDWRLGEAYFAENLLDFDLAANNGGWQWCASTGCDAQPYFRVFNPITQSKKFDEKGEYIKKYCPELKNLTPKQIHWPHDFKYLFLGSYATPIVDHDIQRKKALKLYLEVKK